MICCVLSFHQKIDHSMISAGRHRHEPRHAFYGDHGIRDAIVNLRARGARNLNDCWGS